MIPEQRLVDEGTEFERDLLASARLDAGSARGLDRTLAAMTGASTAAASVGVSAAGTSLGHAAVLVKWIGLAAVVVGISASALSHSGIPTGNRSEGADAVVATSPAVNATVAAGVEVEPAAIPPSGSRPPSSEPSGTGTGLTRGRSVGSERAGAAEPPPRLPSTLDAEVSALHDVREALSRGDTLSALRQLDAFDHSFPRSQLAEEAVVLRIDALARHGDRIAAGELARRFLSAHPTSAHAPRLRALIADAHIP
jgi:hypothetical protein